MGDIHIATLICITSAFIHDAIVKMWQVNQSQVKLTYCLFQMKGAMATEAFINHELNRFSETCDIPLAQLIASALSAVLSQKSKLSADVYPSIFVKDIWEVVIARTEKSIIERSAYMLFDITQAVSLHVYTQCALCDTAAQAPPE